MGYKPVGIDENGNLPKRARTAVAASSEVAGAIDGKNARMAPKRRRVRKPFLSSVVTDFRSGHGWTSSTVGAGTNANDTAVFTTGSQAYKVVTDGAGGGGFIEKNGLTVDLTGKVLRVRFKLGTTETEHIKTKHLIVYAGDTGLTNFYQWTLMDNTGNTMSAVGYHFTTGGEWVEMTLPFASASVTGSPNRAAIAQIRLRAADNGGSAPITVWWDAVEVVEAETPNFYPNGVVSVVFDDNTISQYTTALPYMQSKGLRGSLFVIRDTLDTSGFMSTAQLKDAAATYGFEIACHADTLADHSTDFHNLTQPNLRADLRGIQNFIAANGYSGWEHLAYPKGAYHRRTLADVEAVFTSARTTVKPNYHETLPPADPYRVRTLQVFNTDTVANVTAQIDRAYSEKSWLILTFHEIRSPASASTQYLPADFQAVMDYLVTKGIPVVPYGEVLANV